MTGTAKRYFSRVAILLLAAAATFDAANAAGQAMKVGTRTTQPIGHYEFCQDNPTECRQRTVKPKPQASTSRFWTMVSRVNTAVNREVAPKTDRQIWGRDEVWSFPTSAGDCEDFVLEKRRRLMALGIPGGNLLITVLRQQNGEGHAVLTVRTVEGDFLLDNLDSRIKLWSETSYVFLKRQSESDSGVWLSISDGRADAVASVR